MNSLSLSQVDALGRAIVREQINRRNARLVDRARVNLMLRYGSCRAGTDGQGRVVERGEIPARNSGLEY
jgi:hypothetical protein